MWYWVIYARTRTQARQIEMILLCGAVWHFAFDHLTLSPRRSGHTHSHTLRNRSHCQIKCRALDCCSAYWICIIKLRFFLVTPYAHRERERERYRHTFYLQYTLFSSFWLNFDSFSKATWIVYARSIRFIVFACLNCKTLVMCFWDLFLIFFLFSSYFFLLFSLRCERSGLEVETLTD